MKDKLIVKVLTVLGWITIIFGTIIGITYFKDEYGDFGIIFGITFIAIVLMSIKNQATCWSEIRPPKN